MRHKRTRPHTPVLYKNIRNSAHFCKSIWDTVWTHQCSCCSTSTRKTCLLHNKYITCHTTLSYSINTLASWITLFWGLLDLSQTSSLARNTKLYSATHSAQLSCDCDTNQVIYWQSASASVEGDERNRNGTDIILKFFVSYGCNMHAIFSWKSMLPQCPMLRCLKLGFQQSEVERNVFDTEWVYPSHNVWEDGKIIIE